MDWPNRDRKLENWKKNKENGENKDENSYRKQYNI